MSLEGSQKTVSTHGVSPFIQDQHHNKDILSIIKSLDSSKSHGHVSTCAEPVTISLKIIFEESIKIIFPEIWKKKLISFF